MSTVDEGAARAAADPSARVRKLRWKVQLFFLIGFNALWIRDWQTSRLPGVCIPVLNCHGCPLATTYCPIGVMGDMLSLRLIPWVALGWFGAVGALLGRLTCGWVCPFGFLQDLLAKLPLPKWKPPRWTRLIKYVVLAGMVFFVAVFIGVETRWFFCKICPAATLTATIPAWASGTLQLSGIWIRLAALSAFGILMLFVVRGFCRIACPIGAGLALFNRISLLSVNLDREHCTECMRCVRDCPVDIGPVPNPRDSECIYCIDCTEKCRNLKMGFSNRNSSA